jgi:hypothetical protein
MRALSDQIGRLLERETRKNDFAFQEVIGCLMIEVGVGLETMTCPSCRQNMIDKIKELLRDIEQIRPDPGDASLHVH